MKGISTAIVSRNRPLFLRDYLKSLRGMKLNITVFYLATEPKYEEAYLKILKRFKNVKVAKQEGRMVDYMGEWVKEANDYVFISVDDNVCKGPFDVSAIINFMEKDKDIFAFNMRLDPNIKCSPDFSGNIGEYEEHGKFIVYYPATCTGMWGQGYIFEVSSTIYRKSDIERAWECTEFNIVNQLEMGARPLFPNVGKMACFSYAPLSNIHVDSIYGFNLGGIVKRCTDEEAFKLYEEGREIDIKKTFEERDRLGTTNVTELFLKPKL